MWYYSFRHFVKRSNRIHIQKKLLVLLQEAQLIYVVHFLYIFPLISLPCCPLSPFFFTTLRNSDVPAATSTGGECLQWCQPCLPSSGSQQCALPQPCALPSQPPWEPPGPWVLSDRTPPASCRAPVSPDRLPSPSHLLCTENSPRKAFLRIKNEDAFAADVVLQALTFIRARIPALPPKASALVSDELIQAPSREIRARGWAWHSRSSQQQHGHTQLWESSAWTDGAACQSNAACSNRQRLTRLRGEKCKEFVSSPPDGKKPDPQLYSCTDFTHLHLPKTCSSLSSYNNNQRKPGQIFLCCCGLAIWFEEGFLSQSLQILHLREMQIKPIS